MRFIGERLRILRESQSMTIGMLSKKTGINAGYISQIERGQKNPGPVKVEALAVALKAPQQYFYEANGRLPHELLPTMPPEITKFIMESENTPWLRISEKAKREGIPADVLDKIIDALKKTS